MNKKILFYYFGINGLNFQIIHLIRLIQTNIFLSAN